MGLSWAVLMILLFFGVQWLGADDEDQVLAD